MNTLRHLLVAACCLALLPSVALAEGETCEEVAETCLENCHVDYGMEKMRDELTKCIESCQRRLDNCSEGRHEQKRSQFRVDEETGRAPRRDAVDVYRDDEARDRAATQEKPEPYEDFDKKLQEEKEAAKRPPPPKKSEEELSLEKRQQEKADRARKNDPDADNGPVKKQDAEKKKKKDLSGDDWAKE